MIQSDVLAEISGRWFTSPEAIAELLRLEGINDLETACLEELKGRGFDFSIHPHLPPPTHPLWENHLVSHVLQFQETYRCPPIPSVRNHAAAWSGYLEGARIESHHGFTFDTNYFSLLPQGRYYMTGSGLPMPEDSTA